MVAGRARGRTGIRRRAAVVAQGQDRPRAGSDLVRAAPRQTWARALRFTVAIASLRQWLGGSAECRFARDATVLGGSRGRSRIHGRATLCAKGSGECRNHAGAEALRIGLDDCAVGDSTAAKT
jgi:hypothetical protein